LFSRGARHTRLRKRRPHPTLPRKRGRETARSARRPYSWRCIAESALVSRMKR
jgi:hypothetical protein